MLINFINQVLNPLKQGLIYSSNI